jgi:hypothetical protein
MNTYRQAASKTQAQWPVAFMADAQTANTGSAGKGSVFKECDTRARLPVLASYCERRDTQDRS